MFCNCCLGQLPSFGQSLYLLQGGRVNKPNPPRLHVAAIKSHPAPRISESGHTVDKSTPSEKVGSRERKKTGKRYQHPTKHAYISGAFFTSVVPCIMFYWFPFDFPVLSRIASSSNSNKAICLSVSHICLSYPHTCSRHHIHPNTHNSCQCSASKYRKRDWNFQYNHDHP